MLIKIYKIQDKNCRSESESNMSLMQQRRCDYLQMQCCYLKCISQKKNAQLTISVDLKFPISELAWMRMKVNEVSCQQRLECCSSTSGQHESLCCIQSAIFCLHSVLVFFFSSPERAGPGQIYQNYQIRRPQTSARGQDAKKFSLTQWEWLGLDTCGFLYSKQQRGGEM